MKIALWIVSIVAAVSAGVSIWLLIDKYSNKKPAAKNSGTQPEKPSPREVLATENAAGAAAVARYGL